MNSSILQRSRAELRLLKWNLWLSVALWGLMLAFIILAWPACHPAADSLWAKLQTLFTMQPLLIAVLLGLLIFLEGILGYMYLAAARARLHLDAEGIAFHSRLPRWLQGWILQISARDWAVKWSEVSALQLKQSDQTKVQPGPRFIALKIHAPTQPPEIFPYQWQDPAAKEFQPRLGLGLKLKLPSAEEIRAQLMAAPLLRYLETNQIPQQHGFQLLVDFDLAKNWTAVRIAVLLLLVLPLALLLLMAWPFTERRFAPAVIQASPEAVAQAAVPDSLRFELPGHTDNVLSVAFSPDGKFLASGGKDRQVRIWELLTGTTVRILQGHHDKVHSVVFGPQGKRLISGSEDNTVKLWDSTSGELLQTLTHPADDADPGGVFGVAVTETYLASANWNGSLSLWSFPGGEHLQRIAPLQSRWWGLAKEAGDGHYDAVNGVAFSPDGTLLASASFDASVKLWRVAEGRLHLLHTLPADDWVVAAAFSPDGTQLAAGGFAPTIEIWDVAGGALLRTLPGHRRAVFGLAFHPKGEILASASEDRSVRLWQAGSGHLLSTLRGPRDFVNSAAFSPDGKFLAAASGDDNVRVWWNLSAELERLQSVSEPGENKPEAID